MEKDAPGLLPLYRCLGLYTVDLAKAKGTISQEMADALTGLFEVESTRR
jgi:hypothetical protein